MEGKTFADGTPIPAGIYYFDAEGKMVRPEAPEAPEAKNGVINGYLYIDDVQQKAYQLVEYDGNFYFVSDGHKVIVDGYKNLSAKHVEGKILDNGSPILPGIYYFDSEGKLVAD